MKPNPKDDLRQKAEDSLNKRAGQAGSKEMVDGDSLALINELQVHQIELKMQNEELRRLQAELAVSESKYRDLYEFAPIGYLTLDGSGKILEANLTSASLLGTERVYLVNNRFQAYLDKNYTQEFNSFCSHVLESGEKQAAEFELNYTVRNRDAHHWVLIEAQAMQGNICQGFQMAVIDITKRRLMEEELRKARDVLELRVQERTAELSDAKENLEVTNEDLQVEISEHEKIEKDLMVAKDIAEAALHAKSEFLAVMSHELRTPLNGVLGMASLLAIGGLSSEQLECVAVIQSSSESLLTVINDILNFTKMESEKVGLEKKPFNLRGSINDAVNLLSPKARAKGLDITYSIDGSAPKTIISDQKRLRQVLLNLLDNAIKFTDKGRIDVSVSGCSLENGREKILFSIKDTGIGIFENDISKLFKPFSQVDMSNTRKYGGTGLGLAISRGLVELMGGKIWVESEVGRSSTFHFTIVAEDLPDRLPDNSELAMQTNMPENVPVRSCRVMLAEDNQVNQAVTLRMLKKLGYTAEAVASGREAIESLERQHYDLILMDVQMPDTDGLEATKEIRKLWPNDGPRIIALTAHALEGDRERCIEAGMDDYIAKPVAIDGLAEVLSKYQPSKNRL